MTDVHRPRFAHVLAPDLIGMNRDDVVTGRQSCGDMRPRGARARREGLDGRLGFERRLATQGRGEFVREAAPLFGGRGRERAERTDRAVARALRGGDGLDKEMIDVRLNANPASRTLDEHAAPISLLSASFCQGKSRREFVTILEIPGARPRDFRDFRGTDARELPFARRGPWKLG